MTTQTATTGAEGGATKEVTAGGAGEGGTKTGVPGAPAWLPNADQDTTTYIASKGWDKSSNPAEAILGSYRNLEKLWGADKAGSTVQIPGEGADDKTRDAFYNRLGRPETADKYSVKAKDFAGMPEELAQGLVTLGHKEGFTDKQLAAVAKWNNESSTALQKELETNATIEAGTQATKLKQEWGAAHDQNLQVAKEAATKLGWTADQINAMQLGLGYDGVMKLAHQLGVQVGEGKFISGEGGRTSGADGGKMTPGQASAELKRLTQDPTFQKEWLDKAHPNHKAAIAKKAQLSAWSIGEA